VCPRRLPDAAARLAVLGLGLALLSRMYELRLFEVSQERTDEALTRLPAVR
jgi:hypothetical protein